MVDIKELLEKLEQEKLQQRKNKIKEWLKMNLKDLMNLIKMVKNSGMKDIKFIDLGKILRG